MRRKRLLHKQYSSRLQAFVTHLGVLIKTRLVVVLLGGVFLAFGLCSMPSPFKDDWATRDGTGTVSEPSFKPGYHRWTIGGAAGRGPAEGADVTPGAGLGAWNVNVPAPLPHLASRRTGGHLIIVLVAQKALDPLQAVDVGHPGPVQVRQPRPRRRGPRHRGAGGSRRYS